MTASHHRWPMKPPLEPAAIVRPVPVQTRSVDLWELRKAIDRYGREQKHFNKSARRSRALMFDHPTAVLAAIAPLSPVSPALKRREERESSELLRGTSRPVRQEAPFVRHFLFSCTARISAN